MALIVSSRQWRVDTRERWRADLSKR